MQDIQDGKAQDASLSLIHQSAMRTLELLHAQQREMLQHSRDFSAQEAGLKLRQQQADDLQRGMEARQQDLQRKTEAVEARERQLGEQAAILVRPYGSWVSFFLSPCHACHAIFLFGSV